jgi:hypothetical protein
MIKSAGGNMRCGGKKHRKKEHGFNDEWMKRKREMKEALRKFKEKDDDESRIKYWESRTVQNKRSIWQEKEAEQINSLGNQMEVKKIWEAIRNIARKRKHNYCKTV